MTMTPLEQEGEPQSGLSQTLGRRGMIILSLCTLMMFIEGYDLAAMPLTVPRAASEWGIAPARFGWSLSAVVAGIGIAAILLAPLGDRFGRKPTVLISALTAAAMTLGTATAASPGDLTLWRLATGLALGTCLPNTTAFAALVTPDRLRTRALTMVIMGVPLGSIFAGFSAEFLAAMAGWRAFFWAAGAITILAAIGLAIALPTRSDGQAGADTPPRRGFPVMRLLDRDHVRVTLTFVGWGTTNTFLIYLLTGWLPTLLPRAGVSINDAAQLSALFQVGGLLGSLTFAYAIDRGFVRSTFLLGYLLAAIGLLLLAAGANSPESWLVLLIFAGIGISGAHSTIMVVGAGFIPSPMLSSFFGLSIAVTRIGAIAGPIVGGAVLARSTGAGPFLLTAIMPILICIGAVALIPARRVKG